MNCGRPDVRKVSSICEHVQSTSFFQLDLCMSCTCEELFFISTQFHDGQKEYDMSEKIFLQTMQIGLVEKKTT